MAGSVSFVASVFSYKAYLKTNDSKGMPEDSVAALFKRFPYLAVTDFVMGALLAGRKTLLHQLLSGAVPLPYTPSRIIDGILLAVCREKRFSFATYEDEIACGVLCIQRLLPHASRHAVLVEIAEAILATGNLAYAQCFFENATPTAKGIFGMIFFLKKGFLPNLQDTRIKEWVQEPHTKSAWPSIYKRINTGTRFMQLVMDTTTAYKNSYLCELWRRIEKPALTNRLCLSSFNSAVAYTRFSKWLAYLDNAMANVQLTELACEIVLSGTDMAVLSRLVPILAAQLTGPRLSTLLEMRRVKTIEFLSRDNLAGIMVVQNLRDPRPRILTDLPLISVLADIDDEPLKDGIRASIAESIPQDVARRPLLQLSFSIHSLRGKWISLCVSGAEKQPMHHSLPLKRVKYA